MNYSKLREMVNFLHQLMEDSPVSVKQSYYLSAGGILNAYREGDISFDAAVELIESGKLCRKDKK